MTTTIRAAVLTEPGKPLTIREVQLKDPGPREVRIALRSTGLCGTDLHVIEGSIPHALPVVLGHEGMGEVVDIVAEASVASRGASRRESVRRRLQATAGGCGDGDRRMSTRARRRSRASGVRCISSLHGRRTH